MSLAYPIVNRDVMRLRYPVPSSVPVLTYGGGAVLAKDEGEKEQPARRARISAPPPYSEEDPAKEQGNSQKSKAVTTSTKEPSLLLEVAVGYRLAQTIAQRVYKRRQDRLQRAHDAWMRLGVDTRLIVRQGGTLPPHFWSPPHYGPEEMNARLRRLAL